MLKILLPVLILLSSMVGAWAIVSHRSALNAEAPVAEPPQVHTLTAHPESFRLDIHSQGVVTPRTEINLVAETAGKIVRLHPAFVAGGFFHAGDILAVIDPRDYDHAAVVAQGRLAEAQRLLAQEEAAAKQARNEWQALGEGEPTPLALHAPQVTEARAKLAAAEAELAQARLQRARCEVRAPFAGRVREKRAGIGQYLLAGEPLVQIYSVDAAEIRLPLTLDQTAWLALPTGYTENPLAGPAVTLSARIGGVERRWRGRIVRVEGALDPDTGLLHAVAEVVEPYRIRDGQPPLLAGTFVQAEIEGQSWPDVFALPQNAVSATGDIWLVDDTQHLHRHHVDILRSEAGRVLIRGGLKAGERVLVAGVDTPFDGMAVRVESP